MKKNLILYILLAFLIIVNGFFLFNFLGKPNPEKRPEIGNFIVKELKFDTSQMQKFEQINDSHHQKMEILFRDERRLKDELFSNISDSAFDESAVDSLTTLIGSNAKKKDAETFHLFKSIQNICTDQQKNKLESLIGRALRQNGEPGGNPPPPPRK